VSIIDVSTAAGDDTVRLAITGGHDGAKLEAEVCLSVDEARDLIDALAKAIGRVVNA
jgi:hypothetical protein